LAFNLVHAPTIAAIASLDSEDRIVAVLKLVCPPDPFHAPFMGLG
jgi:hypothetical protein